MPGELSNDVLLPSAHRYALLNAGKYYLRWTFAGSSVRALKTPDRRPRHQTVAIRQGHLVSGVMITAGAIGVVQNGMQVFTHGLDAGANHAGHFTGFDSMLGRVLQQRLQRQGRDQCIGRYLVDMSFHLQPLAQSHLFQLKILPAKLDLLRDRSQFAVVRHQRTEQPGQILERGFAPARLLAN